MWGGPTDLEGSTDYTTPGNITLFEHWYSGITGNTSGSIYYSGNVTPGKTYDIYFDSGNKLNWGISSIINGTGAYTASVYIYVWEYRPSVNAWYFLGFTYSGCYFTPITVIPTQSTILIGVYDPVGAAETFAFGIEEQ